jgi:hypothetical protein
MLDLALGFLRDELNSFLAARTGSDSVSAKLTRLVDDTGKSAVVLDSLGISLIQIDEDKTFRAQLPTQTLVQGQQVLQQPEIKLNLIVMIGANFSHYEEALKALSFVLLFFQSHTLFTSTTYPALDERIAKLTVELQSLTLDQLNQAWTFIGGKQLPSVCYKIRLVLFQDVQLEPSGPPVLSITTAAGMR